MKNIQNQHNYNMLLNVLPKVINVIRIGNKITKNMEIKLSSPQNHYLPERGKRITTKPLEEKKTQ